MDKFEVVKEYLVKWCVKGQLVGMVFDTTASNSGEFAGFWRPGWNSPILWLTCLRNVAELHLAYAVKYVTSSTEDPGMALFHRLRSQWKDLEINCRELELTDFATAQPTLQE